MIGVLSANYFAEDDFDGGETFLGYRAGMGAQLSPRFFLQVLAGREDGTAVAEGTLEFALGNRSSLEFFVGGDLEGNADAWFAGLSFNLLHD